MASYENGGVLWQHEIVGDDFPWKLLHNSAVARVPNRVVTAGNGGEVGTARRAVGGVFRG